MAKNQSLKSVKGFLLLLIRQNRGNWVLWTPRHCCSMKAFPNHNEKPLTHYLHHINQPFFTNTCTSVAGTLDDLFWVRHQLSLCIIDTSKFYFSSVIFTWVFLFYFKCWYQHSIMPLSQSLLCFTSFDLDINLFRFNVHSSISSYILIGLEILINVNLNLFSRNT